MTLESFRPETQRFLEEFFAGENQITLDEVLSESTQARWARLQPWVDLLAGPDPQATVLPCWRGSGGRSRVEWYALAFSERQLRRLSEELLAFVGPTYSTFRGHRPPLDPKDPVAAQVLDVTGGRAFRFRAVGAKNPKEADSNLWKALERWRRVRARRVERTPEVPRTTWRILRDFQMALRAGSAASAEAHLRALDVGHQLDARNLLFLRIEWLAEFGRWEEILALPGLDQLLRARRPAAVTLALVQAVYRCHLEEFEERSDVQGAVARFHEEVLPRFGTLFTGRRGMRAPEVLKSLMLVAVGPETADPLLREEVMRVAAEEAYPLGYFKLLAALLPAAPGPEEADPLARAAEARLVFDYGRAYTWALQAPPGVQRAQVLFECALVLHSLEAQQAAVAAIDALPVDERDAFLTVPINQELYFRMVGGGSEVHAAAETAAAVPTSWLTWLQRLNTESGWGRARALEVARQGMVEWSTEALRTRPTEVEEMVAALHATRSPEAEETLHLALPFLLGFLQRGTAGAVREFAPLYDLALDLLVMSTAGGEEDRVLFFELSSILLSTGISEVRYREILRHALDLWDQYSAPATLTWILDLLDLLVLYPSPAPDARLALLHAVTGRLGTVFRKMDSEQWRMLELLCTNLGEESTFRGLGAPPPAVAEENVDPFAALERQYVAIYTLTEDAGRRAKDLLERRTPKIRIELFHDLVASDRLQHAARTADLFIVATGSATHAATGFIDAKRARDRPTLRPAGKGTASILQALRVYLSEG